MKEKLLAIAFLVFAINVNAQGILKNYTGKTAKAIEASSYEQSATTAIAKNQVHSSSTPAIAKNIQTTSIITLGTSANAIGMSSNGRTCLWADNNLNTVAFIHRATTTPGSGYLQYDLSTDGGATWTTNKGPIYTPDASVYFNARYPQGAIYNPSGNTNPNNAYVAYYAPTLSNTNGTWGGICYGVHKLDGTVAATKDEIETSASGRKRHMIPDAFHICQNGVAWIAEPSIYFDGTYNHYKDTMMVSKGVFNTVTNKYDYTISLLRMPVTHVSANYDKLEDTKIAFSPNGQTGYISLIAHDSYTFMPDSAYYPILYKTIDGGTTWTGPIRVNISALPGIQTLYGDSILYTTAFEHDLAVDGNGNPYMTFDVSPAAGNWSIVNTPGMFASAVVYSTDGCTSWTGAILSKLETFRGTFGMSSTIIVSDNRNQISTNMNGTKMFMTWLDTDTLSFGSGDGNYYPDIHLRAIDVASGNLTPVYNVTTGTAADGSAYMGSASYYVFGNTGTYEIPLVYQQMDPYFPENQLSYKYIKGFTITDGVFANIAAAGTISGPTSVCQGQTSVNYTVPVISGATSYIWTLPTGATGTSSTNSITVNFGPSAISGNITVKGHNSIGDGTPSSLYINVYPIPSPPTAGNNGPVCEGSLLSLTASTISSASYFWTGPNSYSSSTQNPTVSGSATALMAGSYNISVTVHGCTSSTTGTTTVVVKPKPSAPVASNNGPVCKGTALILNATTVTGASYAWTGPNSYLSTQQNPTVSGSATSQMAGTYYVHSILNACSSVNASTTVAVNALSPVEEICFVEFDTNTYKNSINWTTSLPVNVDSIHIYNEVSTNVWSLIGSKPATQNNFIDMNSNPFSQSYSYKITTIDTCGNESDSSIYHTTITLLAAYDQGTNTYGFTWSAYQGLSVPNYYLYGLTSSGAAALIGTVNGNQYFYNYVNPSSSYVRYFVGFNTPTCGSKTNYLVKSNWIQTATVGISESVNINDNISIYPNPAFDNIIIETHANTVNGEFVICNINGQEVLKQKLNSVKNLVNIESLTSGIYFVKVINDRGVVVKKFIKE